MKLAILESPYAGDIEANVEYAQKCIHDMLLRGEAPYASHLLYTQPNVLDDTNPQERELGLFAGFVWKRVEGVLTVFYTDRGISSGMQLAIDYCIEHKKPYEMRKLY